MYDTQSLFEKIFSVSVVIIALCALFISVWSAYQVRHHNKLSVRPKLILEYSTATGSEFIGLSVSNYGLGPAYIKSFELFYDNSLIKSTIFKGWDTIVKLSKTKIPYYYFGFSNDSVLDKGGNKVLFGLSAPNQSSINNEIFFKTLSHVTVRINYESIYEESFVITFNEKK